MSIIESGLESASQNSAPSSDSSALAQQVQNYSLSDRSAALNAMSPNSSSEYLPQINIGDGASVPGASQAGQTESGASAFAQSNTLNGSEQAGASGGAVPGDASSDCPLPLPPTPNPNSNNVEQLVQQIAQDFQQLETYLQGLEPTPPTPTPPEPPTPTPPEPPTPTPPTPTPSGPPQEVQSAINQVDHDVETGSIGQGLSDLSQNLTKWQTQNPSQASTYENDLMQGLESTNLSDGESGSDVINQLGLDYASTYFPLYSTDGHHLTAASLMADATATSDPAQKALLGGAVQWLQNANIDGRVENDVLIDGVIVAGSQNQQQYEQYSSSLDNSSTEGQSASS